MKLNAISRALLSMGFLSLVLAPASRAGHETKEVKEVAEPVTELVRTWFPDEPRGFITFGGLFSEEATGAYFDSITGLWAPRKRDAFLFLNSRYHYEDNGQFISSTGLGFRKLLPDHDVIFGVNGYWDSIHSANDNDFGQVGLGVEILTHWIDARFNYYQPDDERYEIGRRSERDLSSSLSGQFAQGGMINRNLTETTRTRSFKSYEAALEGFNGEVGFLVPGLDRYLELRAFAGYYHYDNPFGSDFEGFKARVEARFLPGVMADVEYWDDAKLMGGHWTAGVRVSVPFSIYRLVTLRNPFEGIGDSFTPRQRAFKERMGDMVMRSHRIQTTTFGDVPSGDFTSTSVTTVPARRPGAGFGGGGAGGGGGGFPIE